MKNTLAGWKFERKEGDKYWAVLAPDGALCLARDEDGEGLHMRMLARLAEALAVPAASDEVVNVDAVRSLDPTLTDAQVAAIVAYFGPPPAAQQSVSPEKKDD